MQLFVQKTFLFWLETDPGLRSPQKSAAAVAAAVRIRSRKPQHKNRKPSFVRVSAILPSLKLYCIFCFLTAHNFYYFQTNYTSMCNLWFLPSSASLIFTFQKRAATVKKGCGFEKWLRFWLRLKKNPQVQFQRKMTAVLKNGCGWKKIRNRSRSVFCHYSQPQFGVCLKL